MVHINVPRKTRARRDCRSCGKMTELGVQIEPASERAKMKNGQTFTYFTVGATGKVFINATTRIL